MPQSAPASGTAPHAPQSASSQVFWFAAAKTIAFILATVFPLLLVRLISQTEFGLYKQAFLVLTTAMRVLLMGFSLSAFYFFPRMPGREGPVAANIVAFHFVTGLAAWMLLAFKPDLLGSLFNNAGLIPYGPLIGFVLFVWVFSSFLEYAPAARGDTRISTRLIVGMHLARTVLMVSATLIAPSVESLLWAAGAQAALQSLVLMGYLNYRFPGFLRQFSTTMLRQQFAYVLPMVAAYWIVVLSGDIPQFIVAAYFDPAAYALYAVGTFSLPLLSVLQESVGMVMIPLISKLHHEGRFAQIVAVQVAAMRKMAGITLPCYFCLLVLAEPFIVLLYGPTYRSSSGIFAVNLLLLPLMIAIYDPLVRVYTETQRYLVMLRAVLLVFLFVGVWAAASTGNMMAVIYPVVAAAALERLGIGYKLARTLGLTWRDKGLFADIGRFAVAAIAAALPAWALRTTMSAYHPGIVLALCSAVYGITYVAAVLALQILTPAELATIHSYIARFRLSNSARTSVP
jgi:O-antigen/teichoic acid export membrane protein